MTPHPRPRHPLRWILPLLALSLALRIMLPAAAIEALYSRGVFRLVRGAVDYTLGWSPLPLYYLFWPVLGYLLYRVWRSRPPRTGRLRHLLFGLVGLLALLVVAFLWLWGFNYGRTPVEERLDFAVHEPPLEELRDRVERLGQELRTARARVTADTAALDREDLPADLEATVRPLVAAALTAHGYPAPGRPRGRQLRPRGILLRLSTAGVYWPWVAEGNIDAGLHPLQKPAVLAHELAHAYGFGGEGTCSFWAYLAGERATDPALRYAYLLDYWRRLAGRLNYADPEGYQTWRARALGPGIRNDLAAIYANSALYEDIAPALRDATYDAYLKAQGIHDGMLSYGRVVQLVEGYRRNYPTAAEPAD